MVTKLKSLMSQGLRKKSEDVGSFQYKDIEFGAEFDFCKRA